MNLTDYDPYYTGSSDGFQDKIDEYYSLIDDTNHKQILNEVGSTSFGASYTSSGINFKKSEKRISKTITNKDQIEEIISIDHFKAMEKSTIMDLFADFGDGPKYQPYYIIDIPPHKYGGLSKIDKDCQSSKKTNSSKFTTTVGLWIFNKAFIEPMSDVLGYINEPITKDVYGDINKKISYALLEDKITVRQLKDFIMQSQIMMSCCSALSSSHTELMFTMEQDIAKKKEALKKKYGKKLEENDLVAAKNYENELIDYAKDLLKDDPAVDMFNSGARSSWGNNFKSMYLLRGPLKGTDGSYNFVDSSYIEGMDPKDFKVVADSSIQGPYGRSKLTASGGYTEKLFTYSTQHLKILSKGSDCVSKETIKVLLTKNNIKDWYFSNIVDNGKLVELTPEIESKYLDKEVNIRYSALCKSKNGICEACAGTFFNRTGISNIGVASMVMMSSVKNANMKRFHDSSLKLAKINPANIFK